jgi:hypothetical protein
MTLPDSDVNTIVPRPPVLIVSVSYGPTSNVALVVTVVLIA